MARRRWERTGQWRMAFAPGAPRQALLSILDPLARRSVPEGSEIVKRSRLRHVFRVRLVDGSDVFVKHYLHRAARPLGWLGAPSRALEELSNLERLAAVGVAAVEPLGCAERHRRGRLEGAVLVTRALPGARPFAEALAGLPEPDRARLLGALARSLRGLHDAGFWHRDLHAGNVLLRGEPEGGGLTQPVLVDVQKLRSLPFPLPGALRVRDLAMLGSELGTALPLLEEYLAPDSPRDDPGRLRRRVARAAARRVRSRLRSRGRRCVQVSTGFRIERHGHFRVYRRADIEASALLAALPEPARASRTPRPPVTRIPGIVGGPPAGPPPDAFARGQGRPEPGAPAHGAVAIREFSESLSGRLRRFEPRRRGRKAWRRAHAALLRGIETPAPLALLEERRLGRVVRSHLVVRWDDRARCLGAALGTGDEHEIGAIVRAVGRFLARLHGAGLVHRPLALDRLLLRSDPPEVGGEASLAFLVLEPHELRVCHGVSPGRQQSDRDELAAALRARLPGVDPSRIREWLEVQTPGNAPSESTSS